MLGEQADTDYQQMTLVVLLPHLPPFPTLLLDNPYRFWASFKS